MSKPASRVEAALWELCAKFGHCPPANDEKALLYDPPHSR
jgi:hypothetical protein